MARNERNDVDYFPHPVTHGKKMFYLRTRYGNDGYTVWFMLLENLGKASHHYLDLSDDIEMMYLSSELKVTDLVLKEIINSLIKLGEFDKELWEDNTILFNEKFVGNISDAYKKRNNDCINKNSLLILLDAKGIRKLSKGRKKPPKSISKGIESTQSKPKESKPKESKKFLPPSIDDVKEYFDEKGYTKSAAERAFNFYDVADWKDSRGNQVKNWKQKMISVWFKPENKIQKTANLAYLYQS